MPLRRYGRRLPCPATLAQSKDNGRWHSAWQRTGTSEKKRFHSNLLTVHARLITWADYTGFVVVELGWGFGETVGGFFFVLLVGALGRGFVPVLQGLWIWWEGLFLLGCDTCVMICMFPDLVGLCIFILDLGFCRVRQGHIWTTPILRSRLC